MKSRERKSRAGKKRERKNFNACEKQQQKNTYKRLASKGVCMRHEQKGKEKKKKLSTRKNFLLRKMKMIEGEGTRE